MRLRHATESINFNPDVGGGSRMVNGHQAPNGSGIATAAGVRVDFPGRHLRLLRRCLASQPLWPAQGPRVWPPWNHPGQCFLLRRAVPSNGFVGAILSAGGRRGAGRLAWGRDSAEDHHSMAGCAAGFVFLAGNFEQRAVDRFVHLKDVIRSPSA